MAAAYGWTTPSISVFCGEVVATRSQAGCVCACPANGRRAGGFGPSVFSAFVSGNQLSPESKQSRRYAHSRVLMRRNVYDFLVENVARRLNRLMLALLPTNRREWGDAIVAEQQCMSNGWELLMWAAGGIVMSAKELLRILFSDRMTWAASL